MDRQRREEIKRTILECVDTDYPAKESDALILELIADLETAEEKIIHWMNEWNAAEEKLAQQTLIAERLSVQQKHNEWAWTKREKTIARMQDSQQAAEEKLKIAEEALRFYEQRDSRVDCGHTARAALRQIGAAK